ncbi:iron-containing redox enzyme family protein [Herbaspirillum sp. LeCh32-8]|uniref:iron-containing redox enzyme family protein n=1 Tax=Herbaspirillum sp. LeCh32-8 TaxID=2821356 RepID=UPI001AE2A504|nr:iron-containing redox enzyme family protein [Herbaspirillum sp. LeCh32-8]MBP0599842.1 iron-containing redox enzyme family protein [Herbaspirillum sp. LeCh32-8]
MRTTAHELAAAESASRRYQDHSAIASAGGIAAEVYGSLFVPGPNASALLAGRQFLDARLRDAEALDCDLPADPALLAAWMEERSLRVGEAYEEYLQQRTAGAPRRFFSSRAHALNFLMRVAPTKLVDGAWLYSALKGWRDPLLAPLILTYLEELGDGDPAMNHVALFRSLLQSSGCEHTGRLSDEHYVQGAIQLALAHHGHDLQAEVFGFNLGYEQLPLHLLITAYELNELGIDPYYFTLHVTIDNAASGHARKAAQAVMAAAALAPDRERFLLGVRRGYLLNELGASTMSVIESFDTQREVVRILAEKARYGKMMHSDYCRIGGKTVNEWLEEPASIARFLVELVNGKWILRGAPAEHSRFWRLVNAAGGEMFGVFTSYEKAVLKEWIEDGRVPAPRTASFRAKARTSMAATGPVEVPFTPRSVADLDELIAELAPGRHYFSDGLLATRVFSRAYRHGPTS